MYCLFEYTILPITYCLDSYLNTWILGYFVGRLIDHLTNSSGVNKSNGVDLDDLEFFVLNEAGRLCKWKVQLLGSFC
jgi:hypothetical protein